MRFLAAKGKRFAVIALTGPLKCGLAGSFCRSSCVCRLKRFCRLSTALDGKVGIASVDLRTKKLAKAHAHVLQGASGLTSAELCTELQTDSVDNSC